MWERGLKCYRRYKNLILVTVAPLVGAWIEILQLVCSCRLLHVAPLVGAWIEISVPNKDELGQRVAPLVGAWIEIAL